MIAGAWVCLAHHAPEAQHDTALVGGDDEDAAGRVQQKDDRDDPPRIEARRPAVRKMAAHFVEHHLDVGERIVAPPAGRKLEWSGHGWFSP